LKEAGKNKRENTKGGEPKQVARHKDVKGVKGVKGAKGVKARKA
jgi:hypothetical protein